VKKIPINCEIREIEEIFQSFGRILNSKIVYDENGNSLGYGFLMFQCKESVEQVMMNKNEFFINRVKLEVQQFVPKTYRIVQSCNVYIRGFPENYSKDNLDLKFSQFGEIVSSITCKKSSPFGFISFKNVLSAEKAISCLDGKVSDGILWFVKRSVNKADRILSLKQKKVEVEEKWKRQNLYVKNWPLDLNEDQLRAVFERFGEIDSVKFVTRECLTMLYSYPMTEIKPTGQVFICFSSEKSADLAMFQMRQVLVNNTNLKIFRWVPKNSLKKPKSKKISSNKENLHPVPYFNSEKMRSTKLEDRKRVFGEAIYQEIFCKYGSLTGKITGMIIELDESELLPMMLNKFKLYAKAKEAVAILNNSHVNK
jgi:polyadenylate-binding protein